MLDWNKFNDLSILIIDDDQLTRELIKTMLEVVPNITIHQAYNGLKALEMIEDMKFDMIFLDLYMPFMNGQEFIEESQKVYNVSSSYPPIVLISTDKLSRVELKDIGIKYYLTKPFDFHNFLETIYSFLELEVIANET